MQKKSGEFFKKFFNWKIIDICRGNKPLTTCAEIFYNGDGCAQNIST